MIFELSTRWNFSCLLSWWWCGLEAQLSTLNAAQTVLTLNPYNKIRRRASFFFKAKWTMYSRLNCWWRVVWLSISWQYLSTAYSIIFDSLTYGNLQNFCSSHLLLKLYRLLLTLSFFSGYLFQLRSYSNKARFRCSF